MLKRFDPEAILFQQGDPSDHVILILSGSAEVLRQAGDDAIVLGTVGPGEFVGEMGVLEGRARSATVRAADPVEAELIDRDSFLERVSVEPDLARKLLLRMSARLRDVEDMLTQLYTSHEEGLDTATGREMVPAAPSNQPHAITLVGSTFGVKFLIGPDPIPVSHLPYVVGRQPDRNEPPSVLAPDLAIPEDEPHRLSRAHFSLIKDGDAILVRDLNSTLGTVVNGRSLGRDFSVDSAPLQKGENTLVAGGDGSPFAFVINLT
ncbi:MAG: cyclic nucleotide-binding domain-containing protein [Pseudomonadota bacterium]